MAKDLKRKLVLTMLGPIVGLCLGISACGDKKGDVQSTEAAVEDAQTLNAAARDEAIAMIAADLNSPLQDLQNLLVSAAADGRISSAELWMQGSGGPIPTDWWLWNKGYLRLVDDPLYGPYFTLSEKGERFAGGTAPAWLVPTASGAPRMDCRAAGSLTSASCTALITYTTAPTASADLAQVSFPAATANLEAAFTTGEGWSVSQLSVDGDAPRDTSRFVIFGDAASAAEPRQRFAESVRQRLEAGRGDAQASQISTAAGLQPQPASGTSGPMIKQGSPVSNSGSLPVAPRPAPPVITNPSWSQRPDPEVLSQLYPERALANEIEGRATMVCVVTAGGTLRDCQSTFESPPGYRFGQATVSAARYYRLNPGRVDGEIVDGARVSVTINWALNN